MIEAHEGRLTRDDRVTEPGRECLLADVGRPGVPLALQLQHRIRAGRRLERRQHAGRVEVRRDAVGRSLGQRTFDRARVLVGAAIAEASRESSRFWRVSPRVAAASTAETRSAPTAKAMVMRARNPGGEEPGDQAQAPHPWSSGLELVAEAAHGHHMAGGGLPRRPRPSCAVGARARRRVAVARSTVAPHALERVSRLNTRPGLDASSTSRRNSVLVRWISSPLRRTTPSSGMISRSPNRGGCCRSRCCGRAGGAPGCGPTALGRERLGEVVVAACLDPATTSCVSARRLPSRWARRTPPDGAAHVRSRRYRGA